MRRSQTGRNSAGKISLSGFFRLEDITQYYTEEELGPAYEYAGDKITELVEKNTGYRSFCSAEVYCSSGRGAFHRG